MIESSMNDIGIVVFRCTGRITFDNIVDAANEFYSDAKQDEPSRALWDTREARFAWSLEDMNSDYNRDWAGRVNKYRSEDRVAVVVNSNLNRIISELSRDALGFEFPVEVFDNYAAAYKGLNA